MLQVGGARAGPPPPWAGRAAGGRWAGAEGRSARGGPQELAAAGRLRAADYEASLAAAAAGGHAGTLAWLLDSPALQPPPPAAGPQPGAAPGQTDGQGGEGGQGSARFLQPPLFTSAAKSGRLAVMALLAERACPREPHAFSWAAAVGCEEALEWLASEEGAACEWPVRGGGGVAP